MGVINQYPEGFLDLLKAKVGGRPPTSVSDSVAPVIDMKEFYLARFMDCEVATTLSTVGNQSAEIVPEGEFWLLFSIALSHNVLAAGDAVFGNVFLQSVPLCPVATREVPIFSNFPDSPTFNNNAIGNTPVKAQYFAPWLPLAAGVEIRTEVVSSTNAAVTLTTEFGFFRLIQ